MASQLPYEDAKGLLPVNTLSGTQTYVIEARFDRALKLIRNALEKGELSIAEEIDLTEGFAKDWKENEPSKLLMVECPILEFEALVLDRAAAVFFPLHVLVSADHERTQVVCFEPATFFEVRLPVGAAHPLEELRHRVEVALESLL